jgi:hypothetical protein
MIWGFRLRFSEFALTEHTPCRVQAFVVDMLAKRPFLP